MRVFKPFWSFKIKAMENWLKEKALQGDYLLSGAYGARNM